MKTKLLTIAAAVFALIISVQSCEYNSFGGESLSDEQLFSASADPGYTFYQNGQILNAASASPHGSFKLRFNEIAATALNNDGELPAGATFPEGSMLVKEVYQNNQLALLAVIKKARNDRNASSGWLWAEYGPDGSVVFSITKKGNGCTSCHGDTPNRDLVRTFDLH